MIKKFETISSKIIKSILLCFLSEYEQYEFIILTTCFGYVIAIIRPTRIIEVALDAALFRYEALIVRVYH
jgi:hypothetical protein